MEYNKSIKNVVMLIFDQCKERNSEFVNVIKVIEYITPNFDLNSDEADQLQISNLFALLKEEGKGNNSLITEEQFEKVLQLWIPSIQCSEDQIMDENYADDDTIFSGSVHQRLSRSLTNLRYQIDNDRVRKSSYCHNWLQGNLINDENSFSDFRSDNEPLVNHPRAQSPHDDPFRIPLNVIKSTPIKRKSSGSAEITCVTQPNLRHLRQQHIVDQLSFSDSDAVYPHEGSYIEDDSSENVGSNKEINRSQMRRKRHRSSIVGQADLGDVDNRDLLSQLKQIKFKNSQLVEINDRLQSQLENTEDNLRNLTTKCLNLEKKGKLYSALSEENRQFVAEIDDIKKCLEQEIEFRRNLLSEKIMTESELTMSKEHVQTLHEKLSLLDHRLEEKDLMINSLRCLITQQQEFCSKLQELNLEKDDVIVQNERNMKKLSEIVKDYEDKIDILTKEKEVIQKSFKSLINKDELGSIVNKMESVDESSIEDICCSVRHDDDREFLLSTNSEFRPCNTSSPWSIKVELTKQLVDSRGDNPFCEKMVFDDQSPYVDLSDEDSFNMLKELLSVLSSLRMTLAQYKEHLESASITIKGVEHFSDEITLSYISYLDDSISLLAASTDKAARCQNQINETFETLVRRIANLKRENKCLLMKNEQLRNQIENSPDNCIGIEVAEKITFLEEELRKERLSGSKKQRTIEDFLKLNNESWRTRTCHNCGRSAVRLSVCSDINRQYLATEALNLERDEFSVQQKRVDIHRSFSNVEKISWLKGDEPLSHKSSTSIDDLILQMNKGDNDFIPQNEEPETPDDRNYYFSTDDLSDIRYKLNVSQPSNIDINKIIENTWLETNSAMDERRASVFAQVVDNSNKSDNAPSPNGAWTEPVKSAHKTKARPRKSSSSCSSSNDTSDANSIDVNVERQKLAQELENRNFRMQTRSPVPSSLGIPDDMKSITPTVNEEEQTRMWANSTTFSEPSVVRHESRTNSPVSVVDECSATESVTMDIVSPSSRRSSSNRQTLVFNSSDSITTTALFNGHMPLKPAVPTISIVEVSMNDDTYQPNSSAPQSTSDIKSNTNIKTITRTSTLESDSNSLQASLNKSNLSSRANSFVGDDSKLPQRSRQGIRRQRRPYTIAGIGLGASKIIPDDLSSNCDEQSTVDGVNVMQESIDLLQEMRQTLLNISPEELEIKLNELSLIYRTDRPTVVDRANDANKKCNKALNNVEQEFDILRHLIKSLSHMVEQPSEFIPRIKTSLSVLEKCVEYLSAKSEILGAVEQEVKMSSIIDVMNESIIRLTKQREENMRELEEVKLWRESTNDISSSGSFDQSRSKRSVLAGKDAKTRFQMAAQNTVMKSSIIRQFAASSFAKTDHLHTGTDNNDSSTSIESRSPFLRGASMQSINVNDTSKLSVGNEAGKIRKYTATKFFQAGGMAEESGESLFQKGLHQGLRLSTDQALTEMRAEQSKFSTTLDSLSDMIEEYEPLEDTHTLDSNLLNTRIVAIKERVHRFLVHCQIFVKRSTYVIVGFIVIVALVIPWLLTPADNDSGSLSSSFSVPASRRRPLSIADIADQSSTPSTPSSSPSSPAYFANVNVVRHRPAAV